MQNNVFISDTPEQTARSVAKLIEELSFSKKKQSLPLNIALSGGSTPKLLFDILSADYATAIPWDIVRLFWVDERCVAPDHEESNYGMTYTHLLKNVPIPSANIFRMQGENSPEIEAKRYAELLKKEIPTKDGIPCFDLILLGMGDDGHTASIFPNSKKLLSANSTVAVATHPQSGQQRITLTGNVLNNAEQTVFLITGTSKSTILQQIINDAPEAKNYPAAYINSPTFYIDQEAGKLL